MLRPEMKPVDGSPSGGAPTRPKPKPQDTQQGLPPYIYPSVPPTQQPVPPPIPQPPSQLAQPSRPDRLNSGPPATTRPQPIPVPPDLLDINPDTVGNREHHIAALNSGQSTSGSAPDIEWSPEHEPSGIVPFAHAAAQGTRDSSEDKTTAICEALYAADPEVVARGLKLVTGFEPDDEEQDIVQELTRFLRTIAPHGLFEDEPWYTTKFGSSESLEVSLASEAPELNRRMRYSLTEGDPGEWDASLTEKEDLERVLLIPKLKRLIHGFDEDSVN